MCFFEMRFNLGTLDSGERSLPFGLFVYIYLKFVTGKKYVQKIFNSSDLFKFQRQSVHFSFVIIASFARPAAGRSIQSGKAALKKESSMFTE